MVDNILSNKRKKIMLLAIICFLVFISYFSIHYYQIFYKGYPLEVYSSHLIIARNLHFSGSYAIENKDNVYLSSDLISGQGIPARTNNKLTPLFYKFIFDYFGFSVNLPLYLSLTIWSLSAVFVFLILYKLFNLAVALLGSLIDIFLPYFWISSTTAGFYEIAVIFFIIGLFFYLSKSKKFIYLLMASILFGLAVLARNAFVVSFIALVIFELYNYKSFKRLLLLFFPAVIIVGSFFIFDYAEKSNFYLTNTSDSFSFYAHSFPDPYTYHFNRDEFIRKVKSGEVNGGEISVLEPFGYRISLKQKLKMYLDSAIYYPKNLFRLPILGGPIMIWFMLIGFYCLFKEKIFLAKMFVIWLAIWYTSLVYLQSTNYDHFIEIRFIIVALAAYGLFCGLRCIYERKNTSSNLLLIIAVIFIFLQIIFTTKYILGRAYESNDTMIIAKPLIDKINSLNLSPVDDVIAVGRHPALVGALNYYTNKNYIYFTPETIKELVNNNKIDEVFKYYKVTYLLNYSEEINKLVSEKIKVNIINLE